MDAMFQLNLTAMFFDMMLNINVWNEKVSSGLCKINVVAPPPGSQPARADYMASPTGAQHEGGGAHVLRHGIVGS